MNVVRTEALRKEFRSGIGRRRITALEGLTLQVEAGVVFGLLGPNGSGKTTAMKILVGLCAPTSGKAWVLGTPVGNVAVKREIGFLPEHPYFYDYLTAQEFLEFYGRLFGLNGRSLSKRIDHLLELVGLTHSRKTRLRNFSKGMLQRIGLAQALINDPRVVFLDEPNSGLDPLGRRAVRDIILDLRDRGKTVFFNSHILPDVEMICDRVAILSNGRLVAMGQVSDLIRSMSVKAMEAEVEGVRPEDRDQIASLAEKIVEHPGRIMVVLKDDAQVDALLKLVPARGWRIRSLTPHRASLEEIFLQEISEHRHVQS